ncbi:hypothetical protein PENVUL_c019G03325 [Penicillium vulpinum]|uniref:F-box domain-containing protein n=1 Tax=Penicillium vulpinum TaxID=29845 RepID=A0A1V6RWH8_9EURO|nr:hypothetical protein PENVUL_c019G03325 [Penicillium vulpinum]
MNPYLPPETLTQIFSFLPKEDSLASYATVCKTWQAILERRTFSTICLTPSRLPEFRRILGLLGGAPSSQSRQRRDNVTRLEFKVILPEYDIPARAARENKADRNQNNQTFTAALKALWEALSEWPEDMIQISLFLCAQSPSDCLADPDDASTLPPIDIIGELEIRTVKYRKIASEAMFRIISRLPRLRTLRAEIDDNERDSILRNFLRQEFALSIDETPKSLQSLILVPHKTLFQNTNLPTISGRGKDSLSLALSNMSQQLQYMELDTLMVGPELFWPPTKVGQLCWPKLTTFKLSYTSATPSGDWLLEEDPRWKEFESSESDLEEMEPWELALPHYLRLEKIRTKPTNAVNEIYLAAGRAAQYMPRLRTMSLRSLAEHEHPSGLQHVFERHAQHWFCYERSEGKATWVSSGEFHATKDVREVWNMVAKSHGHDQITIENLGFRGVAPSLLTCKPGEIDEEFRKRERCFSWEA